MMDATYIDDRAEFLAGDVPGSFHVQPGKLMFRCPCGCGMINVFPVAICSRPASHYFDWNGSVAVPTLEPGFTIGVNHWSGRLSGGVWIKRDANPLHMVR